MVAVAPLPEKTQFDRKLTEELNTLLSQSKGGVVGLAQFLDAAITTQKIALESLGNVSCIDDSDRGGVERYLEDNTELLDSCNYFVDKMEGINKYVDTLRVVAHLVDDCKPNSVAARRALELLESCEKRCRVMGRKKKNSGSCLKKLLRQKYEKTDLGEIMCGSKAMALMCCSFLETGLSFESKSGLVSVKQSQPVRSSWLRLLEEMAKQSSLLTIDELQQTVTAARELKVHMKGKREKEMKSAVERLKKRCRGLEDGIEIIEGRVKDLYRSLIDVRMALLGILSQA